MSGSIERRMLHHVFKLLAPPSSTRQETRIAGISSGNNIDITLRFKHLLSLLTCKLHECVCACTSRCNDDMATDSSNTNHSNNDSSNNEGTVGIAGKAFLPARLLSLPFYSLSIESVYSPPKSVAIACAYRTYICSSLNWLRVQLP